MIPFDEVLCDLIEVIEASIFRPVGRLLLRTPDDCEHFVSPLAAMAWGQLDLPDSDLSGHRCNNLFIYNTVIRGWTEYYGKFWYRNVYVCGSHFAC